jgi:hypothetical protein
MGNCNTITIVVVVIFFAYILAVLKGDNSEIKDAIAKIKDTKVKNELKVLCANKTIISKEIKLALIKQYSLEEGYNYGELKEVFTIEKMKECTNINTVPTNIIIEMAKLKEKLTNNAYNYTLYLVDNKYYVEFTYNPIRNIDGVTVYTELKNK